MYLSSPHNPVSDKNQAPTHQLALRAIQALTLSLTYSHAHTVLCTHLCTLISYSHTCVRYINSCIYEWTSNQIYSHIITVIHHKFTYVCICNFHILSETPYLHTLFCKICTYEFTYICMYI